MTPPFTITSSILSLISQIERMIGHLESFDSPRPQPQLRKSNRVKTLQGSLSIEGNSLDLEQVTAVLDGKKILASQNDILEIINANEVYERLTELDFDKPSHLLKAHEIMMKGLLPNAGQWRTSNVGILKGGQVSHMAPPAERVHYLMTELFEFLKKDNHPLIQGCVFHYEFEFIHPFPDGNGRMGRFWHSLLLYRFHHVFEYIPVESIIKKHQQKYYDTLEQCDKMGNSTLFIEFSLSMILEALNDFLAVFRPKNTLPKDRLETAKNHFKNEWFSRKRYMEIHKVISTATASRDLKNGLDNSLLTIKGNRATSRYQFRA